MKSGFLQLTQICCHFFFLIVLFHLLVKVNLDMMLIENGLHLKDHSWPVLKHRQYLILHDYSHHYSKQFYILIKYLQL